MERGGGKEAAGQGAKRKGEAARERAGRNETPGGGRGVADGSTVGVLQLWPKD